MYQNLNTEVEEYMVLNLSSDLREHDRGRDHGEEEEEAMAQMTPD
jgi:hypothetical protein